MSEQPHVRELTPVIFYGGKGQNVDLDLRPTAEPLVSPKPLPKGTTDGLTEPTVEAPPLPVEVASLKLVTPSSPTSSEEATPASSPASGVPLSATVKPTEVVLESGTESGEAVTKPTAPKILLASTKTLNLPSSPPPLPF